ncbi:MAG TPA: c-type cytochrome [Steroidobacteraceae bacterium]|nr:c-type cytochrome [Steroidobacteraceae bacterium]
MSRPALCRRVRGAAFLVLGWTAAALAANSAGEGKARPRTANAAPCEACHGAHGEGSPAGGIPRLAGQSADYIEKQLRDFENGTRESPVMRNFAKGLSDSERAQLASYYASLTAPPAAGAATADARQLGRGQQLAFEGDESERVQACDNCHGPYGIGLPHSAPYLAGQSAAYLANALRSWREGTRKNDGGKQMSTVVDRLSDADIAAASAYFASVDTESN